MCLPFMACSDELQVSIHGMTIRSDPAPTIPPQGNMPASPFYLDPSHRLFVITLNIVGFSAGHNFNRCIVFFVPLTTFLEAVPQECGGTLDALDSEIEHYLPWEHWGPHGSQVNLYRQIDCITLTKCDSWFTGYGR